MQAKQTKGREKAAKRKFDSHATATKPYGKFFFVRREEKEYFDFAHAED
jgi:hypothetical protein